MIDVEKVKPYYLSLIKKVISTKLVQIIFSFENHAILGKKKKKKKLKEIFLANKNEGGILIKQFESVFIYKIKIYLLTQ